jgi:preprotein translocase subunit SecE
MKEKILNYGNDVIKELKKVTWPSQEELKESTTIVIVVCLILALFTWVIDLGIAEAFNQLFKLR